MTFFFFRIRELVFGDESRQDRGALLFALPLDRSGRFGVDLLSFFSPSV